MTPTQRCTADTNAGAQCAQRTAVAHLCWNHLRRDMGVRVRPSSVPARAAACSLARHGGLPAGHRIPYTGDEIVLRSDDGTAGRTCWRRSAAPASTRRGATAASAAG